MLTALTAKLATVVPASPGRRAAVAVQSGGGVPARRRAHPRCARPPAARPRRPAASVAHDGPPAGMRRWPAAGLFRAAVTGGAVHLALGPLTADADLAARTLGFTATGTEGLLHWHAGAQLDAAGHLSFTAGLGDPRRRLRARRAVRPAAGPAGPRRRRHRCRCGRRSTSTAWAGWLSRPSRPRRCGSRWRGCAASTTSSALPSTTSASALGMLRPPDARASARSPRRSGCSTTRPAGSRRPVCWPCSAADHST